MSLILVVDDDRNLCRILKDLLERAGFEVLVTHDVDSALLIIKERDLDLVITDLKMPGKSGMDLLTLGKARKPAVPMIMITAFGDIDSAVQAIKKGAHDFITKPFDEDELLNVINKAVSESRKNRELLSPYFDRPNEFIPGFIGKTAAIQRILQTVQKIGPTDSTVLITGETGVGKEIIARAVHLASPRREHPFVKVNCAAIPEFLLESELFGHEKGAFTGAITSKPGRFEIAHQGTLFLDEIGEIPIHLQAKLLAVIQDKAFERVGGVKPTRVDLRIIAATNMDLRVAVHSGKFRPDLFYRLNVVPIHIPPLRERKDDLVSLAGYFLDKFCVRYQKSISAISPDVMAAFGGYDWPGNIRELENVLERMVLLSEKETIGHDQLPPELCKVEPSPQNSSLKTKIDGISRVTEKQMIVDALNRTNQNRTRAAELLGISRRTLQNKLKEYGL